ncbi:MAG: hypothetical protein QOE75_2239 [Solirubrobacterales bacterium]|nr:hypothetical protein [Solirubrobacterales bacterium]
MSTAAEPKRRFHSRTRDLAERRLSLFSVLITAAIAIEAWRAWAVSRVARREHLRAASIPDSGWGRFLRPLERHGPAVIYALTAIFAVVAIVLLLLGDSHEALLDAAVIGREITTFFFLAVVLAGYMSVRRAN